MRPPSALLPSRTMLCWLFRTTLLMFFNIAAPMELGLSGINPNMELPEDSWYIRSKDELERYKYTKYNHKDTTFSPCRVDISGDGFEVFYDELASKKGCTVDLIVNKNYQKDQAIFTAKMMDLDKNCISKADNDDEIVEKSNDNLIPFAFGYTNQLLKLLSKGPHYWGGFCANESECKKSHYEEGGRCIETTMLEIGWSRSDESIYGHLHQVGEPVSSWYIKMNKKEEWDGMMDVKLDINETEEWRTTLEYQIREHDATDEGFLFIEKEKGDQPVCNIPNIVTPTPRTWQIKSIDRFLNGNYILSLHFFPQKSTVYHYGKEGEWKVNSEKKIDGPKCKKQSFAFPNNFVSALLMVGPKTKPTTPSTSTQSTTEITSGSTGMPTTEETTSTTSTIGPSPTSKQTAESGSSTLLIFSIVAGLIAFIILIAILIYCLCCRKKEVANNKEEDEEEDSSEVENSEVFENYQKKQQPSLMTTAEKNKPPGEITTDWTDYETIEPKKKTNVM